MPITRSRSKPGSIKYVVTYGSQPYSDQTLNWNIELIEDTKNIRPYPKSWSPVNHWKSTSPASYSWQNGWYNYTVSGDPGWTHYVGTMVQKAIEQCSYVPLNFQENNSFELLPFLVDLDGTLAMFAKKFWKQISYGSVNWGLLPFISDVKSLINSVKDLTGDNISKQLESAKREIGHNFDIYYDVGYSSPIRFKGKFHFQGTVSYEMPNLSSHHLALYLLLDEIGVHPDLKTLWDVIPLSFVADYFLPVGDYLEAVHPRGWFRPLVTLDGGFSVKGKITTPPYFTDKPGVTCEIDVYKRDSGTLTGSSRPPVNPEWKCPNARQLFNTAYLARGRFRR